MQAILLVMCISWKIRQRQLGIDDFGHPLVDATRTQEEVASEAEIALGEDLRDGVEDGGNAEEETPLLGGGRAGRERKGWKGWIWGN
jgi:hypothetical protein